MEFGSSGKKPITLTEQHWRLWRNIYQDLRSYV
jgi:hypothetical protein